MRDLTACFLQTIFILGIVFPVAGQAPDSLLMGFQRPPVEARPRGYLCLVNGNFSLSGLTRDLEEMRDKGMGGVDIWDVGTTINANGFVPDGPPFMGPESVEAIGHIVREAERLGLEIGLTISSSWNAGGDWVKPEHGAMGIFRTDTVVTGPASFKAALPFPTLPQQYGSRDNLLTKDPKTGLPTFYREVDYQAIPLGPDSTAQLADVVPLMGKVDKKGVLTWQVPAGKWRISRYVCTGTGQPLMLPSPRSNGLMLDHFSAEAQEANLGHILTLLEKELGSLRNRALKYLYTDSYEVNTAIWTPKLPEEFAKRNGYSLLPYLPVLQGFTVGDAEISERFLSDFNKTLSDLIIENHYLLGKKICNRYGLGFVAEAGGPGKPIHNVPFEDLKALGALTIPRGEFWNKHPQLDKLQIVKGIASAAHQYNQKYVEAEAFTSVWLWQEGPAELKPLADRAFCEGLNRFIYHTSPHTPAEAGEPGWVYNFGTLIYPGRVWWPLSEPFHTYLARVSFLMQQGNFVGDVAFYYGDEAPNFVPPKHVPATLGPGYDYDVVNSETILQRLSVKDGQLVLPHGQRYAVLVLPDARQVNEQVLQKIANLVREGATVIGPKPLGANGLRNSATRNALVAQLANELWGACDSVTVQENRVGKGKIVWGKPVKQVLQEMGIGPDVRAKLSVQGLDLDFIHRVAGADDIYFLRNKAAQPVQASVTFRVKNKVPELWDTASGTALPAPIWRETDGGIEVALPFEAHGSHVVVFRQKAAPAHLTFLETEGKALFPDPNTTLPMIATSNGMALLAAPATAAQPWVNVGTIPAGGRLQDEAVPVAQTLVLNQLWEVRFPAGKGAPAKAVFPKLRSLHESEDPGIRHFSGIAAYHTRFVAPDAFFNNRTRAFLDLGQVREVARVYLNGHLLGIAWFAPYRFEITEHLKPGENRLVVEVANTWNNGLVGNAQKPAEFRTLTSNIERLPNAWTTPMSQAPLLPSGLIGPVRIVSGVDIR